MNALLPTSLAGLAMAIALAAYFLSRRRPQDNDVPEYLDTQA